MVALNGLHKLRHFTECSMCPKNSPLILCLICLKTVFYSMILGLQLAFSNALPFIHKRAQRQLAFLMGAVW